MVNAKRILPKENSHFLQDRPHRSFPTKLLRQNAFYLMKMAILFKIAPTDSLVTTFFDRYAELA